jgi:hypothetical protein
MSWFRYLLLPALVVPTVLLTGALNRPSAPPAAAAGAAPLAPLPRDAGATQILERAIEALSPSRISWMETTVWQQLACEDFTSQAEGRFLAGPDQRLRLQLRLRLGRACGEMSVVSDGTTLWQSSQVEGGERSVSRMEVQKVLSALASPAVGPKVRDEFFQNLCFAGLGPMLQGLRTRMTADRRETLSWKGRDVTRLTLHWSPEQARTLAPAGEPWPAYLPRTCLLYLDAASLWPLRLEWWGPTSREDRDTPVLQMEFRDPVLNRPLSQEQCAREFSFDPGPGKVPDQTEEMTELVEARAKQEAGQAAPAGQ